MSLERTSPLDLAKRPSRRRGTTTVSEPKSISATKHRRKKRSFHRPHMSEVQAKCLRYHLHVPDHIVIQPLNLGFPTCETSMTQTVPNLHKNKRENGDNVGLVQHSKAPCGPFGTSMSAHILCVDLWNKITNSFTVAYCSTAHNLTILDSNQSKSREKASSLKRFLHSYVQSL